LASEPFDAGGAAVPVASRNVTDCSEPCLRRTLEVGAIAKTASSPPDLDGGSP